MAPGLAERMAENSGRWRDLAVRAASAAVLLPVALYALWQGGVIWNALLVITFVLMLREWHLMAGRKLPPAQALLGLLWIGPALVALIWLRDREPGGFGNVLFMLCVVWASDIGAYMIGRLIGGPKLAPSISPGKTRSGAMGGMLAAIGVGVAGASIGHGDVIIAGLVAVGLGVVSQIGDLLESAVKRHFGVKDSGNLIPGHGGLLDRLDAVLTVAPVAAALVAWRGVELWR